METVRCGRALRRRAAWRCGCRCLAAEDAAAAEEAAGALWIRSHESAASQRCIADCGGVEAIISALGTPVRSLQMRLLGAAGNVAAEESVRTVLVAKGVLPLLFRLCAAASTPATLRSLAAGYTSKDIDSSRNSGGGGGVSSRAT